MNLSGIIATLIGIIISIASIQQNQLGFLTASIPLTILGLWLLFSKGEDANCVTSEGGEND